MRVLVPVANNLDKEENWMECPAAQHFRHDVSKVKMIVLLLVVFIRKF